MHGKHHLQQIEITRHNSDSINGFNCTKITGAQVNSNGACSCRSDGTILSDENGRLKCENLEDIYQSKIINFSLLINGVYECILSNHKIYRQAFNKLIPLESSLSVYYRGAFKHDGAFQSVTIFAKSSILDVWQGSELETTALQNLILTP